MSIVVGDSGVVVSGVVSGVDVDEGSFIASVAAVDSSVASVVVVDFGVVTSRVMSGIGVLGFVIDALQVQPTNV